MRILFLLLSLFVASTSFAQQKKQKIKYKHADEHRFDKRIDPNAQMMVGNVVFEHEGTMLSCDSAVFYQAKNLMKAYGNVKINQADTLFMYSDYLDYDGNTKIALASKKVKLVDSKMTLKSDTIKFDRNLQIAYYPSFGEIKDSANTLTSAKGTYYTQEKKFVFKTNVRIKNKSYTMVSNLLTYYTQNKTVYFYGPSTITSKDNYIYCENGFYDTRNDISHFKKNSYIKYGNQTLRGDSLYYDRNKGFGSATKNIELNDSTKNLIVRGQYAEHFELNDSTFVTKEALAINIMEKDSLYMHGDTLMMTGIPNSKKRLMRVFHGVKIFKPDLQGKCDSLSFNERTGIMQMMVNPVLWSGKNQMTSDIIIVTNNLETEQLDSLKMLNNGFIVSNDTLLNFNQIKGKNIYGKFIENELVRINVVGNAETIYYARNEANELIGVNKALSSSMIISLKDQEINEITFLKDPEAQLTPISKMPENVRILKGFIWRNDERIKSKADIFVKDDLNAKENVNLDKEKNKEPKGEKTEEKVKDKPKTKAPVNKRRELLERKKPNERES